jgi:hypothetical protein
VGRESELAAIGAFLDEPRASLATFLIEGDVGIGKSTLWREAARAARDRSYRVLACRPDETEMDIGFAGLIDLLGNVANEATHELPEPQRKALDAALMRGSAEAPVEPGAVAVCGHWHSSHAGPEGPAGDRDRRLPVARCSDATSTRVRTSPFGCGADRRDRRVADRLSP